MAASSSVSLTSILSRYDAFLIDLWGVMHDGTALYPGVAHTVDYLHARGKRIVFLSNAPRRTHQTETVLTRLGIPRSQYEAIMTSGEAAHYQLMRDAHAHFTDWGSQYYYLGPSKDENVIADLPYTRVGKPEQADFILNSGFEYDYQPTQEIEPLLGRLLTLDRPLLCINPDIEVVKQDGTRLLCAGWVARHYEQAGGRVTYIGKPYPFVYELCQALLEDVPKSRTLAIGDNLATDIAGARGAGLDSLLITGGILATECGGPPGDDTLQGLITQTGAPPTYILPSFAL